MTREEIDHIIAGCNRAKEAKNASPGRTPQSVYCSFVDRNARATNCLACQQLRKAPK